VSVCLPVVAEPGRALACIDSLTVVREQGLIEVIVMANGLVVAERTVFDERADIVVVRSGTNLGFAGGNNLAAHFARGRYLLLLNDDSTVAAGCVERLVETAEADPTIGAVGCRILSADGSVQEAGSVLWGDGWATHVGAGLPGGTDHFAYVRDVDYASANGLLVRKSAWDAVSGLDERYFPAYFEDADLCLTLRRHHYRVVYEPRARLTHLEGQSTSWRYRNFLLRHNRDVFVAKWGEELATRADRPAQPDDAAVERAIHRARGAPPRVLVVGRATGVGSHTQIGEVAEDLARQGWAVTLVPEVDAEGLVRMGPGPSGGEDSLVDLGVDRRESATEALATVGTDFEAVVARSSGHLSGPVIRPDGTPAPVVDLPPADGPSRAASVADDVAGRARRTPAHRGGHGDHRYPPVMSAEEPGGRSGGGNPLEDELEVVDEPPGQMARELQAAQSEIGIKNAYIASLEADLDRASARIDAFPQVRARVWLAGLRRRIER
jgi:GT2 family glycosyltransferase